MKLRIQKNKQELLCDLKIADNYFSRLAGLMFRHALPADTGLLIKPCKQVHTHFMRFAIDAIFIDSHYQIVHIERGLKPWKVSRYFKTANSVIETNSGVLSSLEIGDILEIAN